MIQWLSRPTPSVSVPKFFGILKLVTKVAQLFETPSVSLFGFEVCFSIHVTTLILHSRMQRLQTTHKLFYLDTEPDI